MRTIAITLAAVTAAIALAACGSSSSSSSSSNPDTAAKAITASGASDNSPIDSSAYRKLIILAATQKGLSPQIASKIAGCAVKKEKAQGYKKIADLGKSTTTRRQAVQDVAECSTQALPAG